MGGTASAAAPGGAAGSDDPGAAIAAVGSPTAKPNAQQTAARKGYVGTARQRNTGASFGESGRARDDPEGRGAHPRDHVDDGSRAASPRRHARWAQALRVGI